MDTHSNTPSVSEFRLSHLRRGSTFEPFTAFITFSLITCHSVKAGYDWYSQLVSVTCHDCIRLVP